MNNSISQLKSSKQNCKYCGHSLDDIAFGLRDFCSEAHRKLYRRKYQAHMMKGRRFANKTKKTTLPTDPLDVSNTNPTVSTVCETARDESQTFQEYGDKDWYGIAKKFCCNFEVREREGYCVTLAEPYQTYRKECSECNLGQALKSKYDGEDKKAKPRSFLRRMDK